MSQPQTTPPASQFDGKAATWDEDPRKIMVAATIAKAMLAALELTPADVVLDYGAGTGLVSLELAQVAGRVLAAEPSEGMRAALCAKIGAGAVSNVLALDWSAEQATPLPENPTAITGSMVLHHVEDVTAAVRVFATLLAKGGKIAFADLDPDGGDFHGPEHQAFHPGFNRSRLGSLFEEAGFTSIAFSEVMHLRKPKADGTQGVFPIFLMTGRKA